MPPKAEIVEILERTEKYLGDVLLPFWTQRSVDRECGGFLTYFDRDGKPTGLTDKTFLGQIRMLYSMSSTHRFGFGGGRCAELATWAADFILEHFWDAEHEGWNWIADRSGKITVAGKVGYGQVFGMYAFSEYSLATGDARGREAAERTYTAICRNMLDTARGGLFELMQPDWQPERPGRYGGDRKSMDVHMHAMEALTSLYEMTGSASHRRRLLEMIDILIGKMLHPVHGTGYIQFTLDYQPLPAIMFAVDWGRDAQPEDGCARPLDYTSYGHNVEFAWLLLHAADVLGVGRQAYAETVRKIFDHAVEYGTDRQYGGVLVEGPHDGPPTLFEKQFWQQAEVLVGMLDAVALFGDKKYWKAFRSVYDFVFDKFVHMGGGGEWFERVARDGTVVDDALGHAWKICYHTMRSMVQTVNRLRALAGQ